ncbi:MAG: glycosyltransferase family 39 protein [Gammaproteobacteria bacterium]
MLSTRLHPAPQTWLAAGSWLILVLVALYTRPLWPIDETRYAAVAWEMWLRGDFLVPYLNGEPYSHKPPLMFWLFQAGWWAFGVSDGWPRLVPSLFALANLLLTARLARLLWPRHETVARHVPLILLGCLLWTFFTTVTLFDMLLTCFTLLGLLGVVHAWRYGGKRGWLLLGAAIGLGMLTKGPVILLHTLPVALLAPWWTVDKPARSWKSWYAGLLLAILLGIGITLAWAIPAALAGGKAYGHAIFWGQTANRLVESFAHRRQWWWYMPLLPGLLFPWFVWPPLWRGLQRLWRESRCGAANPGVRFCLAWMAPAFIMLSAISGKQVQYLLPALPAFALLVSYAVFSGATELRGKDGLLPGLGMLITGLVLVGLPYLAAHYPEPEWAAQIAPLAGIIIALAGILLILIPGKDAGRSTIMLSLASTLLMVMLHWGVLRVAAPAYDVKAIGRYLHALQSAGTPIVHAGKYFGQYQFLGRLEQPLQVIEHSGIESWIKLHPQGKVITYSDDWRPPGNGKPEYTQRYRGSTVTVWAYDAILSDKE